MATLSFSLVTYAADSARLGMATLLVFLGAGLLILITTPYPASEPEKA